MCLVGMNHFIGNVVDVCTVSTQGSQLYMVFSCYGVPPPVSLGWHSVHRMALLSEMRNVGSMSAEFCQKLELASSQGTYPGSCCAKE